MFRIIKILSLFSFIAISMSSCSSQFRYVTKKFDVRVVLDSNCAEGSGNNLTVINKNESGIFEEKVYNKNNQLIESRNYLDTIRKIVVGEIKYWYDNGKLKKIVNYNEKWELDGDVIIYYKNGKIKRKDKFKNDKLISGECFKEDGSPTAHTPFIIQPFVDIGNMSRNIEYPENLKKESIQERVAISIYINENNQICEYSYDSNNSIEFVNAAIKAMIRYGKIQSLIEDNEPHPSRMLVPVTFKMK